MTPNSLEALSKNDVVPARKIGVLGGTFDPIHNGHLAVGKFAMREAGLDEVVFVPAGRPWMKQTEPGASPEDRLEMVRLALEGQSGMTCSDVDVVRPGHTYTVDTLTDLRLQYGRGAAFYLIVGADTAEDMHRWDRAELLPSLCTVVVIGRPGSPIPTEVEGGHPARGALFLQGPMREVSASAIRDCLNGGGLPVGQIPPAVARYMDERGLYGLSRENGDMTERRTAAEKAARLLERAMELGALELGEFTLSSGQMSKYYFDGRLLTLDPEGSDLISSLFLEEIVEARADAAGGPTVAAVPIAGAIVLRSQLEDRPVSGFFVRPEVKGHGGRKQVEGPVEPGMRVAVFDDAISTGGSLLPAIDALEAIGCQVVLVMCVVDRMQGGSDEIRRRGLPFYAILQANADGNIRPIVTTG